MVFIVYIMRKFIFMVIDIHINGQPDLPQIIGTHGAADAFARSSDNRQENNHDDADYGDDDKKLD